MASHNLLSTAKRKLEHISEVKAIEISHLKDTITESNQLLLVSSSNLSPGGRQISEEDNMAFLRMVTMEASHLVTSLRREELELTRSLTAARNEAALSVLSLVLKYFYGILVLIDR